MASLPDRLPHSRLIGLDIAIELVEVEVEAEAAVSVSVSSQWWRECPRKCRKRSLAVDRGLPYSGRWRDLAVGARASRVVVRKLSLWSEAAACWPTGCRCLRKTAWRYKIFA